MKELSEYTDEELRQEMKRRVAEQKAQNDVMPRCRNCAFYRIEKSGSRKFETCSEHTYFDRYLHSRLNNQISGYAKACKDFKLNENI